MRRKIIAFGTYYHDFLATSRMRPSRAKDKIHHSIAGHRRPYACEVHKAPLGSMETCMNCAKKGQPIFDVSAELDAEYGAPGTPERAQFDEEAYAFYTAQLLQQARKEAHVTQAELARRTYTSKSYISRVEHGDIVPSVGKYWQMISSLGMRIEIVSPIG